MPPLSAGVLVFDRREPVVRVLLGHPGGPFWAKKDEGVWSVPKGLLEPGEDARAAAFRELLEETGLDLRGHQRETVDLGVVSLKSGKEVHAWALEHACDPRSLRSNEIEIVWPPRSRRTLRIPEIDRFGLFALPEARSRIHAAQAPFLERLARALGVDPASG